MRREPFQGAYIVEIFDCRRVIMKFGNPSKAECTFYTQLVIWIKTILVR